MFRRGLVFFGGKERLEPYDGFDRIGDFDADEGHSRDGRFDAERVCRECIREFVLESHNAREFDTLGRLQCVAGDRRPDRNFIHLDGDAVLSEGSFDDVCVRLDVADAGLATVTLEEYLATAAEAWMGVPAASVLPGSPRPLAGIV